VLAVNSRLERMRTNLLACEVTEVSHDISSRDHLVCRQISRAIGY